MTRFRTRDLSLPIKAMEKSRLLASASLLALLTGCQTAGGGGGVSVERLADIHYVINTKAGSVAKSFAELNPSYKPSIIGDPIEMPTAGIDLPGFLPTFQRTVAKSGADFDGNKTLNEGEGYYAVINLLAARALGDLPLGDRNEVSRVALYNGAPKPGGSNRITAGIRLSYAQKTGLGTLLYDLSFGATPFEKNVRDFLDAFVEQGGGVAGVKGGGGEGGDGGDSGDGGGPEGGGG